MILKALEVLPDVERLPTRNFGERPIRAVHDTDFVNYLRERGDFPNARQLAIYLEDRHGVRGPAGGPLSESALRNHVRDFKHRYRQDTQ